MDNLATVLIVIVLVVSLFTWIVGSAFEASAYNRITNSNVTTWEAMFVELRVQSSPSN